MDTSSELRRLIEQVLAGTLSVPAFERQFTLYWYEHVSAEQMRSQMFAPFSSVVEQLEFVKPHPSAEECADGWIDYDDFLGWLRREDPNASAGRGDASRPAV